MVSPWLVIFELSNLCKNLWVTVDNAQITVGITILFMFHSFFSSSLAWSKYLPLLFFFFQVYSVISRKGKVHYLAGSLYLLLTITMCGRMAENKWYVCFSKSKRILCVPFSWMDFGLCIIFVRIEIFLILAQFPLDYLPHSVVFSLILILRKFTAFT